MLPTDPHVARPLLARRLRLAHAAELAAALAYVGHARSVRDPDECRAIAAIGDDERRHRARLGDMLASLGARPSPWRERLMTLIGRAISAFCHVGGWYLPMYGAGRIERRNIAEYEEAARLALLAGRPDLVDDLLEMGEVEWDHELYFRTKAASHRLSRIIRPWSAPPPRVAIRETFERFRRDHAESRDQTTDRSLAA
jgi:hypothetical protein